MTSKSKSIAAKVCLLAACILLFSCNHKRERAIVPGIYYWKTYFRLTDFEKNRLDSLQVEVLYVKFFDVVWEEHIGRVSPVAKLMVKDSVYLRSKKIIPTVFITNEVFYHLDSAAVKTLAANTASLLKKYTALYGLKNIEEVQMDCDWTVTTRDKYFYFLSHIKSLQLAPVLSATIRLHQVKYTNSSGVPPVNKGLLMCYNMGSLQKPDAHNSIIDAQEFKGYSRYIQSYSLPLDIGLPLFDWYVLFRNNKYAGIFLSIPRTLISRFKNIGNNRYEVMQDTILGDRMLKTGDILRYENSDYESVKSLLADVNRKLTASSPRLVLYHCDSVILSKYSLHELESLYSGLRRY